jgi:hypothetical protein
MEFKLDLELKQSFVQNAINSNRYFRKIYKSHIFLLTFGIIMFILYIANCVWNNSFSLAAMVAVFAIIMLGFSLKLFVLFMAGKDIWTRIDEKLTIQNGLLIYSYRERFKTYSSDRIRVYVPMDKLHKAKVQNDGKTTVLFGDFSQKYVSNCVNGLYAGKRPIVLSDKEINQLVLYNYFLPSVAEHLVKIGELY